MPRAVWDAEHLIGRQNQAIVQSSGRPFGECRFDDSLGIVDFGNIVSSSDECGFFLLIAGI